MKVKLSTRIVFSYSLILLLFIVLGGVALNSMNNIRSELTEVAENADQIEAVNIIKQSALIVSKNTRGNIIFANDPATLELLKNETANARAELEQAMQSVEKHNLTQKEKELLAKYNAIRAESKQINNQVAELIAAKKIPEAAELLANKADPMIQDSLITLNELIVLTKNENMQAQNDAVSTFSQSFQIMLILIVVSIIVGFGGALFITRSITRPINRIVTGMTESSNQVAAASNQLSGAAQQLSQGSAEQASAIEETSSTLQEATSMLQQNSANTMQVAQLSEQAKDSADKGSNEMQAMMRSIQEIKKSSDQIGKIIKIIDDIAFQTNILALNAAVEAARAGEAGMGFAVVAEEVRNLAQRSAQAAKDTTTIIESNIELSTEGVEIAEKVRDVLNDVTVRAKKVNELMAEIAAASQEQTQGIEQVNKALVQMEAVTQQNASSAEESASASEELNAQAQGLEIMVLQLSELVNGKSGNLMSHSNQLFLNQPTHLPKPLSNSQPAVHSEMLLSDQARAKTKVVTPEDVIPLEKDTKQF